MRTHIADDLSMELRGGYLYARVKHRTLDRNKALDVLAAIVNMSADNWCDRMMIERDAPLPLEDASFTTVIKDLFRYSPGIKIAFLNRRMSLDDLAKTIGKPADRCGAAYMPFNDESAAEAWLMSRSAR